MEKQDNFSETEHVSLIIDVNIGEHSSYGNISSWAQNCMRRICCSGGDKTNLLLIRISGSFRKVEFLPIWVNATECFLNSGQLLLEKLQSFLLLFIYVFFRFLNCPSPSEKDFLSNKHIGNLYFCHLPSQSFTLTYICILFKNSSHCFY